MGSQFCLYFSLLCIDFISRVWSKNKFYCCLSKIFARKLQAKDNKRAMSRRVRGRGVKEKKGCGILWEEKTISLFCSIFVVGLCFKRSYWKSNNDVH